MALGEGLSFPFLDLTAPGQTFEENLISNLRDGAAILRLCYYRGLNPCLMGVTLRVKWPNRRAFTTLRWAPELRGSTLPKSKKLSEAFKGKPRDPSWTIRHALGHRAEPWPKGLQAQ